MGGGFSIIFCVIYLIFIFVVYGLLSYVLHSLKLKYKSVFQVLLFIICICIVYYSSWKVCVNQLTPLTDKERMDFQYKQFNNLNKFYKTIPDLISNGEIFRPSEKIREKDSVTILTSLLNLTENPPSKMDSLTELIVASFFYYKGLPIKLNEDSLFFKNELAKIHKTLKVRNIFYSPNFTKFLMFISYEQNENKHMRLDFSGSGNAIAVIGYKKENRIVFYKFFKSDYSYGFFINEDIAYSYCFKNTMGKDYNIYFTNFLRAKFWKTVTLKRQLNLNGKSKFILEIDNPHKKNDKFTYSEPVMILDI